MSLLNRECVSFTKYTRRLQIDCIKDYTEQEAEEYLKFANSADKKEYKFNQVSQEMIHNLRELHIGDLAKTYQNHSFAYHPKVDLSIFTMKDTILSIIDTNSVVVIEGPTGCGKTTQIPQLILDANIKKRLHCNIIVTQPRRIAAMSIARRVSQERGWPIGTLVGYKVGMKRETSVDTRLTYCTTEVLLHQLIHEKHMLNYTHVILDEVHERDQELDFLLLVVKKLLQTNSSLVKVILMSAIFDVTKFSKYFSTCMRNKLVPAPIIKIPEKRSYEIHMYYLDEIEDLGTIPEVSSVQPRITQAMINFCTRIIVALDKIDINDSKNETDLSQRHTVLVFLPGICEITELYNLLSSKYHKNKLWDLVVLHSLIFNDEQQCIFYKPPQGHRRIILSTNIAESSITVPDVKYVIDFCLVKIFTIDPITNYQCLQLAWASKANCVQRAGRTGRTMDGKVYRLVPKLFYTDILNDESIPEMLRAPLENVVLKAKILDLDEPKSLLIHSLDPPNLQNLENTILSLKEAGALFDKKDGIEPFNGILTDLGSVMASLPLNIHISKLIMLGHVFGVLQDAIILGASMAVRDIFSDQCRQPISTYNITRKWAGESDSDSIACLNVYKMWQNEKANRRITTYVTEKHWAKRNGIQLKTLRELDVLVNEITNRLQKLGIKESIGINKVVWKGNDRIFVLQVILAGAFYPNYFVKRTQDAHFHKKDIVRMLDGLDPMKTVYLRGWPTNQPGLLYAKRFQEMFSMYQGVPLRQIMVSFDGSKRIYAQFRKKETPGNESPYKISPFVYQAIKMKQCDVPIKINVLHEKEAHSRIKDYDLAKYKHTVLFNKGITKKKDNDMISRIRPKLPGLDITFIPLSIQKIISPGYFWATLDDADTRETMRMIERTLNIEPLKRLHFRPEIGTMVSAPMNKDCSLIYCRAVIEEYAWEKNEFIDVFFIDYGYSNRIRWSDLREIAQDNMILKLPSLAFQCTLANVRPSNQGHNPDGQWSQVSQDCFELQVYESARIFGEIYSIVDNIIILQLIIVNEQNDRLNINEYLIRQGYAVQKEESYLSRYNHDLRVNAIDMLPEEKLHYEELQYNRDYLLETYPEPPRQEDCGSSVKLQGPYSPLEMEMMQFTTRGRSKKVNIDTISVNSVLLDDNPDCPSGRLLVAQSVNQKTYNGHLILRNTTYLPNIPGLATLLTLIFTPRMELRRSYLATYYTGALCGLGPVDSSTSRGIFPDNDMEIPFDVEITMDDLREINKLRHWMNIGMQFRDNMNDDEYIINCQNGIKRTLLEIRDRQRKWQNPIEIDNFDEWNQYDESLLLYPAQASITKCEIYHLHNGLELRERNDELEEMLKHLLELQHLVNEDSHKAAKSVTFCKLCQMEIFGILALHDHLCSEQHTRNKEKLQI